MDAVNNDKYITFKRDELHQLLGQLTTQDLREAEAPWVLKQFNDASLGDVVVLRRQDLFAGPALHVYAHCISMVSQFSDKKYLQKVADYFHEQAVLADAEGWKLPD